MRYAIRSIIAFTVALAAVAPQGALAASRDVPGRNRPQRAAEPEAEPPTRIRNVSTPATDVPKARRIDTLEGGWSAPEPTGRKHLEMKVIPVAPVLAAPRFDSTGVIPLSLQQSIELALTHHLDIQGSRIDRASAEARVLQSRGPFDPVLNGFYEHSRSVRLSASALEAALGVDTRDVYSAGLTQRLWYGASYEVTVNGARSETNNPNVFLSPNYTTDFSLRYTQPLLRGFGRDANRAAIAQAINNAAIARLDMEVRARDIARDTIRAYWELVFAIRDLEVRRSSLGLAQELLRKNRIMVEVGTLAPLEIAQAEASVAERELRIIAAENSVGLAEDNVRRLIGVTDATAWWGARIVPTDEPVFAAFPVSLDEALTQSLGSRPEVESAELSVASAKLGVVQAKDALLPQINFSAKWGGSGLGVQTDDVDPTSDSNGDTIPDNDNDIRPGDWDEAIDFTTSHDFESWSAQLVYSQPLRNRAAEGDYLVRRLALEDARLAQMQLRQSITLEVRRAVRDLGSASESVASARVTRQLQEKKLDAEIKKFENGLSTNFEVLQFQNDLQSAESAELRALTDYLQAQAELKRSRGSLLADYGMATPR